MKKVAFICVHNSCRSQIAEALGKKLASDVFESYSAGTETKPQINQDAVRLMKHVHGIDMDMLHKPHSTASFCPTFRRQMWSSPWAAMSGVPSCLVPTGRIGDWKIPAARAMKHSWKPSA